MFNIGGIIKTHKVLALRSIPDTEEGRLMFIQYACRMMTGEERLDEMDALLARYNEARGTVRHLGENGVPFHTAVLLAAIQYADTKENSNE